MTEFSLGAPRDDELIDAFDALEDVLQLDTIGEIDPAALSDTAAAPTRGDAQPRPDTAAGLGVCGDGAPPPGSGRPRSTAARADRNSSSSTRRRPVAVVAQR